MEVISYLNGRRLKKDEVIEITEGELYEAYKRIMNDVKKRISTTDNKQ